MPFSTFQVQILQEDMLTELNRGGNLLINKSRIFHGQIKHEKVGKTVLSTFETANLENVENKTRSAAGFDLTGVKKQWQVS
jgi:hypothetical protein